MGWTVQGSIPGGGRFSASVQAGCEAHPASYTVGTGSFPGVKWPECGVGHPPPSNAEVKQRVEYLYSPSRPSWSVLGWTLLFYFTYWAVSGKGLSSKHQILLCAVCIYCTV